MAKEAGILSAANSKVLTNYYYYYYIFTKLQRVHRSTGMIGCLSATLKHRNESEKNLLPKLIYTHFEKN